MTNVTAKAMGEGIMGTASTAICTNHPVDRSAFSGLADPVFILAAPRSFTSVVCGMLGQHPQLYALPELQLFGAETMTAWWQLCGRQSFPMKHGLLRAVAELFFGGQSEHSVRLARSWVRRRSHFTTGMMFEVIAKRVCPRIPVDKSPMVVYRPESLQRMDAMFSEARFIHLVRHPRGHAESVLKAIRETGQVGPVPGWLSHLASFPEAERATGKGMNAVTKVDPQRGWYVLNKNICNFLGHLPEQRKLQIRAETLLNQPEPTLGAIANWLEIRTDSQALEEMLHPERSPYACVGPPGANYGNDLNFLKSPVPRRERAETHYLDGALPWREDRQGFTPEVRQLAMEFGYE
jgi:hypothetical protein